MMIVRFFATILLGLTVGAVPFLLLAATRRPVVRDQHPSREHGHQRENAKVKPCDGLTGVYHELFRMLYEPEPNNQHHTPSQRVVKEPYVDASHAPEQHPRDSAKHQKCVSTGDCSTHLFLFFGVYYVRMEKKILHSEQK